VSLPVALGIDLGTSGVKAALLDQAGTVHATTSRDYAVLSPHPGWAETEPALWERATRAAVQDLLVTVPAAEVVAVGIDGQMHGTVLIDDRGVPVRPAVLWPDARASDQMPRWRSLPDRLHRLLANPLTPGMPGPVLAWLAEHEPDPLSRAVCFMMPKDWLRSRLVQTTPHTDASDASASLLWDVPADLWSTEVATLTGVPTRLLPPVRPSGEAAGHVAPAAAAAWGLPEKVPVSTGCSDVAATLLGLDARPGRTVLTVGTGVQLVLPGVAPDPARAVRHHLYRDAGDGWYAMGAVLNGGLALTRVVKLLGIAWDDLYRPYDTDASLPGFLPYFAGERLPDSVEGGHGGWFDVGLDTTGADLAAAALEGVAFAVRRAFEAMPDAEDDAEVVVDLVGGGSRSPVFNQLLADVLQRPLRRRDQRDVTVVGAARLGFRALGADAVVEPGPGHALVEPREPGPLDERYERFLRRTALPGG
jgi:xylulokinase